METTAAAMSTMNQQILTHNSTSSLNGAESVHLRRNAGHRENIVEDLKHKGTASNYPDVVRCISVSSQSQESVEDYKDPDIVLSSFSSDEKSLDNQILSNRAKHVPRLSGAVHSSVSSFSSSDGSKQSTSSYPDSDRNPKASPVCSHSSGDNDDLQNSTKFLFNEDSVFAQESEDVFDPPHQFRKLQLSDTASTITKLNSSLSKKEAISNGSCSEKGQKARNRFSSSGYCTGSGESAQGNSTSKISIHLSQELDNTVLPQGTQILNKEEPVCVVDGVINPDLKDQTRRSVKPMHLIQNPGNVVLGDKSFVSKGTEMEHGSSPSSQEITDDPSAPINHQNSECINQQASQNHNDPASTDISQDKKQSQVTKQNVMQYQASVADGAKPHNLQGLPQPTTTSTYLMGLQQQQLLAISGRSSTGYADSPQHMWQSSLQHLLTVSGSLNHSPVHMSSSSSSSCFLPQSVEYRWNAESSHVSIAKLLLLQSGPGASESSGESRYHLESLIQIDNQLIQTQKESTENAAQAVQSVCAQGIPDFEQLLSNSMVSTELPSVMLSSFASQADKDILDKLEKSVRCYEADCDHANCMQTKKDMAALHDMRNHVMSLSEAHKMLLLAMFNHMVYFCDHPKCPFPWCGEHEENCYQLLQEDRLKMMKQRVENFADHFVLPKIPIKYMKLKATSSDQMPIEDQDWVRLCMMGNSRRTLLVRPTKPGPSDVCSDSEYWVLKKVSTTDDGDMWSLYSRLREVSHRSVATLLWAACFQEHMLVCSLYEGFSLYECLPSLPPPEFRFATIFSIMQQLTSATRHLNGLGIVYLYWISKNIQVTYYTSVDFVVKLNNFSCSVLLKRPDGKPPHYDRGHLLLALPRHIIPPELRDNIGVEFVSDIWGLACLLHELVTGHPVWHEYRHVMDKDFKSLKETNPRPPSIYPELIDVFTACWEADTSRRAQLSDLEIMLIHAYQVHLMS